MIDQSSDPDTLQASALAGEVRILVGRLRRRLRREAHWGELSTSQAAVVGHLERNGPATVTSLARAEGVRTQSMGAIVDSLEAAGFVTGTPDIKDGRQTILSLTGACRQLIKENRAALDDWLFRAIRTQLTPHELTELAAGIELLKRLADS